MTLHHDPAAFTAAIAATAQHLGLAAVLVEKDYWVSYVLRALADSPYRDQVVFKGGTSLALVKSLVQKSHLDHLLD